MALKAPLLWAAGGVALLLAAAVVWVQPSPDPPRPASAVASTIMSEDELCDALNREAHVMAKAEMREFRRHRAAHRQFRKKMIPYGPVSNPKSVLSIWMDTMHKGEMHAKHYDELWSIMRARGCLAPV